MPFFIKTVKRFTETSYLVEAPNAEEAIGADGEYLGVCDNDILADHLVPCSPEGDVLGHMKNNVIAIVEVSDPYETEEAARESDDAWTEWS